MNAQAFRYLYDYHFTENRRLWDDYIVPLTDEQFTRPVAYSRGSVRDQIAHLMQADSDWFGELLGAAVSPAPSAPAGVDDRPALRAQWDDLERTMRGYLAQLRDDTLLEKPFAEGEDKDLILWQVLLHVSNHGTDHRAQILRELHDLGVKTTSQDLIFYVYDHPELRDDDLTRFEAAGAATLRATETQGYVENEGARLWYARFGSGAPVILLHGGLGHSGNWGYQVPALVRAGYQAIVIDSRGHGRSTRDARPYSYELMASDVSAVMQALHLARASLVGWSDGACTALVLAAQAPAQVAGVFYFGCNMDPSGAKEFVFTPVIGRCLNRHKQDYAQLSATPDQFDSFSEAVGLMQRTQPNSSPQDLARISVPVLVVQSERDEFIKREHAEYLARCLPGARFRLLPGVSHFAPLQRPEQFNGVLLEFLGGVAQ